MLQSPCGRPSASGTQLSWPALADRAPDTVGARLVHDACPPYDCIHDILMAVRAGETQILFAPHMMPHSGVALGLTVSLISYGAVVCAQQCGAGSIVPAPAAGPHSSRCPYIDITLTVEPGMPIWEASTGLPEDWRVKHRDMAEGDEVNQSHLSLDAHTGTHVDAAVHFVNEAYEYGGTVENLDLNTLIGPALVVRVPSGSNITSQVLEDLSLPADTRRLLFITDNTDRQLLSQRAFDSSYTSISASGAHYLAQHTQVALVGIDYLSIGMYDEIGDAHRALLGKGIIAVEGLNMTGVEPGAYHLTCLPAKLGGSDGAPIRCLVQQQPCNPATE